MKLFMFASERTGLNAFTDQSSGGRLPEKHGPWTGTGVIRDDQAPPHGLDRSAIERAIAERGFQLWRRRAKAA
jgi:hypothetical protein